MAHGHKERNPPRVADGIARFWLFIAPDFKVYTVQYDLWLTKASEIYKIEQIVQMFSRKYNFSF